MSPVARKRLVIGVAACAMVMFWPGIAFGIAPDNIEMLVTRDHARGSGFGFNGTIGGYCYDEANNDFYTVIFGSGKGIRRYDVDTDQSWHYVYDYDINLFHLSSDVAGGVSDWSVDGNPYLFAILLNPAPLTITVPNPADPNQDLPLTYQPGELGFIVNYASDVTEYGYPRPQWTKAIIRYDLREVFAYTNEQPDYNNAKDGDPNLGGELLGAYHQVDWNDCFTTCATNQDFQNASGYTTRPYIGRQFAWSSDGSHLYICDHNRYSGGVYKVNATTGATNRVYAVSALATKGYYCEPAVFTPAVRDLGQGNGDQIVLTGHSDEDNEGGISFIVDDANTVSGPHVLVSSHDMWEYLELGKTYLDPNDPNFDPNGDPVDANPVDFAIDPNGNIYYYETLSYGIHMIDPLGRMVCLRSKAQQIAFNEAYYSLGVQGGSHRLQCRDANHPTAGTITEVMYRGYNMWVLGLLVFRPGDFNRDQVIDANDTGFFIDQWRVGQYALGDPNLPGYPHDPNVDPNYPILPLLTDGQPYIDYILADFNGTAMPLNSGGYTNRLEKIAVTAKDLELYLQFAHLWVGDLDWDGDVDNDDKAALISKKGVVDPIWFDGDLDGDGDVDDDDEAILNANLGATYVIDPGPNNMGGLLSSMSYTLTVTVDTNTNGWVDVDPNLPTYPAMTPVSLTAYPSNGKTFKQWKIYDPNHPDDSNYVAFDSNNPMTLIMDADYKVTAQFKCGSGLEPMLPLVLFTATLCGAVAWRRKR